ncbi:MAG: hypothetical protein ACTSYC_00850 [Promethearchaeota archaeon]
MSKLELRPLIINLGSASFRLGWAGDDYPKIIAPSVHANKKDFLFVSDVIEGLEDIFLPSEKEANQYLFGNEALKYQHVLKLYEFKKENNLDIFSNYFLFHYNLLNIIPEFRFKQPLIILTPFYITEQEKAKLQDIFFNIFQFPYLLFFSEEQAIFAAIQKNTGVIVNLGESFTSISSAVHGFTNELARDLFPIAGKDLTEYFLSLILKSTNQNMYLTKWLAREIKEKTALCVENFDVEFTQIRENISKYNQIVNLPDGTRLILNLERILISEPIFYPNIMHVNHPGLDETVAKIIKAWERENWEDLVANIILTGGGSLIPGLKERLKNQLKRFFPEKLREKIRIFSISGRENMSWVGASLLYMKELLKKGWITNPNSETEKFSQTHPRDV